ncbi:MAG: hypothetical protein LBD45_07680, partial [Bacteroidales bacterium]|nr:hypothetical protein [Bacteroidales bacterium]
MKTRKHLLALFFVIIPLFAFGQADPSGKVVLNKFWDNWFFSIGGGAQYFVGDGINADGAKAFDTDRLSYPFLSVSLGKMFTPVIGLRVQGYGNPGIGTALVDSWGVKNGDKTEYNELKYFGVRGDV